MIDSKRSLFLRLEPDNSQVLLICSVYKLLNSKTLTSDDEKTFTVSC